MSVESIAKELGLKDLSSEISDMDREELLRKGWMTHDSLWFFSALGALGIEEANRLNRSIMYEECKSEMKRLMRVLDVERIQSAEELMELFIAGFDIYVPRIISSRMTSRGDGFEVMITRCFAADGIKQAGLADVYECAGMERLTAWADAMGIDYDLEPDVGLCRMARGDECRWNYRFFLNGERLKFPELVFEWIPQNRSDGSFSLHEQGEELETAGGSQQAVSDITRKLQLKDLSSVIAQGDRDELLRKGWMTHDGLWFFSVLGALGIEKTNPMNRSAMHFVGKDEMNRLMRALDIQEVQSAEQLMELFLAAFEIYVPRIVSMRMRSDGAGAEFLVKKCFPADGVRQAGLADVYECAVIERFAGWAEAMGVDFDIVPGIGLCPMANGEECRRKLKVYLDGEELRFPEMEFDWP